MKIEPRNTAPTSTPVTPSMTDGAGDQGLDRPRVGVDQGLRRATLDEDEADEQDGRRCQRDQGPGGGPAVRLGAGDREHQDAEAAYRGGRARDVELREAWAATGCVREDPGRNDERDDTDRDVDPEDRLPAGPGGQHAADEDAGGDAQAADGSPERQALGPLGALVGRHDERQRGRGHQRGADALGAAGRDQLTCAGGEATEERGRGEDEHAGHEDPATGQQVGDAAAKQEAATGHQQVGGDHPLHVGALQLQELPIVGSAVLTTEMSSTTRTWATRARARTVHGCRDADPRGRRVRVDVRVWWWDMVTPS